ncbi:acyl-CoA dehydrogenase [Arthrobacter sp. zg-Y820]|uniref:acyl-CoA dehydrogenase n=1 Tax=unclassified Arthrobacter TaxID=235627 RepID=UPI001E3FD6A1|nr:MULTISPECIES: acyl-CoA dehydrogenase [unclassified Arthrobacter]MCC9195578.1 acyl-CoA dehydrogenase [Arthrobacter sp. zg-Y820]MDK1278437.1 acyl-CoA dehydrogenase [Arthrobacter sp. zg.Y820]WIB09123.1 acyl-CoA dehydrogenase [Arthrobacter sp. zg-Y820]
MALALTEEHTDLCAAASDFASRFADTLATREQLPAYGAGEPAPYWDELVKNGLHSLHISEEHGGQGGTVADTAIVVEEFARRLVPGPYVSTVLASAAVAAAGDCKAATRGLAEFAEGARGALVLPAGTVSAAAADGGWELRGTAPVLSLLSADFLVIGFAAGGDTRFALVDVRSAGVSRTAVPCTDLTRDAGTLELTGLLVGSEEILEGLSVVHVETLQAGLLAAEASGIMRWAVEASTAYAKMREQFGAPIGSFQAIKHKCANLLIAAELAAAAAWSALVSLDQDEDQQKLAAGAAISAAIVPSVEAVTEAVTIFGGIGFTWEHDAHLFWRRAMTLGAQVGSLSECLVATGKTALQLDRRIDIELPDEDPAFRACIGQLLDRAQTLTNEHDGGRWYSRGSQRTFLAEEGLAAPHWSAPYGLGATPAQQVVISQEYARRGLTPPSSVIGEWAMPTILAYGSDAVKEQFALPTLRGELIWCQLFSEPGAGSDLAGLATRAVKVEGGWELKGQKVWTSGAHEADWGICLARTDKDVPKHKGLSYFLIDMRSAGVEVRPLKQSTGDAEFNEVFLDSVFVPDAYLLGEPGQGWRITATTLQNERTQISSGVSVGTEEALRTMISQGSYSGSEDAAFTSLGRIAAVSSAIGALNLRETLRQVNGMQPGAGSSLAKVAHARLTREAASHVLALAGPGALFASAPGDAVTGQLAVPQVLIGGGTVEIQLNVIAERILGLPRG